MADHDSDTHLMMKELFEVYPSAWESLPEEASPKYYHPRTNNNDDPQPKKHWFTLVMVMTWEGFKDRVLAFDLRGTQVRVVYEDGRDFDPALRQNQQTMAILYPQRYLEDDGFDFKTVYVKDPSRTHIFPMKIADLVKTLADARMAAFEKDGQKRCHSCKDWFKNEELLACGGCKLVHYCSKDCQAAAWKKGYSEGTQTLPAHKEVCKIMKDPAFGLLVSMKSEPFEEPMSF